MLRVFLVVAVCTACSSTASPPAKPSGGTGGSAATSGSAAGDAVESAEGAPDPLPFTSDCVKPDDPSVAEVQRRAEAATRAGFEAALARNKLRVITLGVHQDVVGQGMAMTPPHFAEGTAVKAKLQTAEGVFVAGTTQWSGSAGMPAQWELVQDERGDVFRVIRRPRAAVTQVKLCVCRPQKCGPYGSGCPGCGSTYQTMYGPLPAGATYRGDLEVVYPANVVSIEYRDDNCPPLPACPPPPP